MVVKKNHSPMSLPELRNEYAASSSGTTSMAGESEWNSRSSRLSDESSGADDEPVVAATAYGLRVAPNMWFRISCSFSNSLRICSRASVTGRYMTLMWLVSCLPVVLLSPASPSSSSSPLSVRSVVRSRSERNGVVAAKRRPRAYTRWSDVHRISDVHNEAKQLIAQRLPYLIGCLLRSGEFLLEDLDDSFASQAWVVTTAPRAEQWLLLEARCGRDSFAMHASVQSLPTYALQCGHFPASTRSKNCWIVRLRSARVTSVIEFNRLGSS
jgi:hypothetical protein